MKIVYLFQNPGIASRTPQGCRSAVICAGSDGSYSEQDLREIEDADVLVVGLEPVDDRVLQRGRRLRLVQRLGRGHCNIDLEAAARRGIPVCGMPEFNDATVAEHAIMLMLALLRRVFESTLLMKAGRWPLGPVVANGIFDLRGKTLGIVGLGAIGLAVAVRAKGFDMRICYHDDHVERAPAGVERVSLDQLLEHSDIVSLHLPLTPATRQLIGKAELARMKPAALLINTARGELVDEQALADALRRGAIGGAGIDVFSSEPLAAGHPLTRSPNVLLTPHIAGQTREAMERMVDMMLENIEHLRRGEEPSHRLVAEPTPSSRSASGSPGALGPR
jgi:phosphoglycerate dehydrogenase-like enzyme